eukprot:767475-Hanusia_phi.AAC.5
MPPEVGVVQSLTVDPRVDLAATAEGDARGERLGRWGSEEEEVECLVYPSEDSPEEPARAKYRPQARPLADLVPEGLLSQMRGRKKMARVDSEG